MAKERIILSQQLDSIREHFSLEPNDKVSPVCDYVSHVNRNVSPKLTFESLRPLPIS